MNTPKDLLFTKSHEWIKKNDDGSAYIGISDYAQNELGDIVYVNLPQEGDEISADDSFADVESVKAVSDVLSPVSGTVAEINEELLDSPQKINEDPYEAWFVKVTDISDEVELMSAEEYESFIG